MRNKYLNVVLLAIAIILGVGLLLIPILTGESAFGDVGGFSGGHSFSGGGHSSSGSSSSGGGSSSSGSGVFIGGPFSWVGLLVFLGICIIITVIKMKQKNNSEEPIYVEDTFDKSKLQPIMSYKEAHPDFDEQELKEDISNWYVKMQNAGTNKDFSPVEPYFIDSLYAQLSRQLSQLTDAGLTNYVTNIAVLSVEIEGGGEEDNQEFISFIVKTRINDGTEDRNGNVTAGSKTDEKFMTYRGVVSKSKGDSVTRENTQNCPNCGATVNANESAKCPYCGTILHSEQHSGAITTMQGIEEIIAH